jgi:hypothetical protein
VKRVLAAVAVVAAALPVPAVSAHAPRDVRAARAAWLARYHSLGHHLADGPVAEAVAAQKAEEVSTYAFLTKAGDLDGDGHGDVADLRVKEVFDDTTGAFSVTVRVEVHAGRDGRLLWSKPIDGDFPFILFEKVGAQARPGMIVASFTEAGQDALVAGGDAYTAALTAYDGAGKSVWTASSQGAGAGSVIGGAGYGFEIEDVGDLMPGGAADLLFVTWQYADAYDPIVGLGGGALRLQLGVLNGATGATSNLGNPFVTTSDAAYPSVVGDVTGDKRDDVVFVVGDEAGTAMKMHVVSSSDGTEPYAALGLATDYYTARRLTDVTGDGRADLALFDESGNVRLIDGAKGRVAWTRRGDNLSAIGNADRKRGDEVVITTSTWKSDTVGFTVTVINGSGKTVWSKTRMISTGGGGDDARTSVSVGDIGDVQTDGIHDIGYSIVVQPFGRATRREDATLDGRNGRMFRDAVVDMRAAGTAFDGRGVDAYTRTIANGVLSVGGWRGDKPGKLWAVSVGVGGASHVSASIGTDLDRDRCGDLVLSLDGATQVAVALSGATGKPLWVLTRTDDAPGVVTHPSPRTYKRYAKTC